MSTSRHDTKTSRPPLQQPTPAIDWHAHLPSEWRGQVVAPKSFERHRDAEMPAQRCFGYDAEQIACFYSHDYAITEWRSDDDEEFYLCTLHGETLVAWLLRDGRWLVHRRVRNEDPGEEHAFYSFSPTMPR